MNEVGCTDQIQGDPLELNIPSKTTTWEETKNPIHWILAEIQIQFQDFVKLTFSWQCLEMRVIMKLKR